HHHIKTTKDHSFMDTMTFIDLSLMFNEKLSLNIQSERYFFGKVDKENNRYYFLDLEAKYGFKENKLTFFLTGNNLLNTEYFKNYSISDISISKTEYRLLPRYVLLKVEYRF